MAVELSTVIIDSYPVVRLGVMAVLQESCGCRVLGSFDCVAAAKATIETQRPHLVVMELCRGEIIDFNGIEEVLSVSAGTHVLVLSRLDQRIYGGRALACGALGYIEKSSPISTLCEAVTMVAGGYRYVTEPLLLRLLEKESDPEKQVLDPLDKLTPRELEVLHLVGRGMSASEIAKALFLSSKTVDVHRMSIRKKLGLRNSYELVRFACSAAS